MFKRVVKGLIRTLLPQLGLTLLDGRDDHVANTSVRQPVEVRAEAVRLDDEQRLRAAVVRAVQHGADGQTEGEAELRSRGTGRCGSGAALCRISKGRSLQ